MLDEVYRLYNQTNPPDPNRNSKVEGTKDSKNKAAETSKQSASQSDSISISPNAKSALDNTRLMNIIKNLPDVREEKVVEARAKIDSGEIFSPEVTEQLADELDTLL